MRTDFLPEGMLYAKQKAIDINALIEAYENKTILEGIVSSCSPEHNLTVRFGELECIVERCDAAIGIREGVTRDIALISKVGKPICFTVKSIERNIYGQYEIYLSRREAQEMALSYLLRTLAPCDIIPAIITHLEPFGAFCDIGCGIVSFIGIENISVSRISHPSDRFVVGQRIYALVTQIEPDIRKVSLSHKELLGTWEENIQNFHVGETVCGVVRGIEEYGIFVELAPNLSGLAEPFENLFLGDFVSVYIKNINPEKMKIKLVIIDKINLCDRRIITEQDYRHKRGCLLSWQYAPECSLGKAQKPCF